MFHSYVSHYQRVDVPSLAIHRTIQTQGDTTNGGHEAMITMITKARGNPVELGPRVASDRSTCDRSHTNPAQLVPQFCGEEPWLQTLQSDPE